MNKPIPSHHERGQALVLIALAAIILVAFVALAVDGSQAYSQRRVAQNAGDAAAIAGAYRIGVQRSQPGSGGTTALERQNDILEDMHLAAERHGLPDTDGSPGNAVNGNIQAFFTDDEGNELATCAIGTCAEIPDDVLGVRLSVRKEFDTYFAGVIGWEEATIGARALAVVHAGSRADDQRYWAIFADDSEACGAFEGQLSGATVDITGNVHTNGSFAMEEAMPPVSSGQITYVNDCIHCDSTPPPSVYTNLSLEYPNFNAYRALASGEGTTLAGGTVSNNIGSSSAPITYVTGNLTLAGTNQILTGLIFVEGDVVITGRISGRYTIVASGTITSSTTSRISGRPFTSTIYPLLSSLNNVAIFYTNATPANPCDTATPALSIQGSAHAIQGAVMAPNGRAEFTGTNNLIIGCLLGDQVSVSGAGNRVTYSNQYFPPQPDQVELIE